LREYGRKPASKEQKEESIGANRKLELGGQLLMTKRFELSQVISEIDNFLENRELHQKDPDLALRFSEQIKKMEVWFICKVYFDNSRILRKVVDLCQNGTQNDARKFMAFARYSFRQLGADRFEDCINRSNLTSKEKGMIVGFFRIGGIDRALAKDISNAIEAARNGINANGIYSEEPVKDLCY
jgi:hypothetical protein